MSSHFTHTRNKLVIAIQIIPVFTIPQHGTPLPPSTRLPFIPVDKCICIRSVNPLVASRPPVVPDPHGNIALGQDRGAVSPQKGVLLGTEDRRQVDRSSSLGETLAVALSLVVVKIPVDYQVAVATEGNPLLQPR